MSEYRSKRRVIIDYRVFFWSNEPTEKNIVQNDTYSSVDYRYTIPNIIRDVCAGTYWTAADCILYIQSDVYLYRQTQTGKQRYHCHHNNHRINASRPNHESNGNFVFSVFI